MKTLIFSFSLLLFLFTSINVFAVNTVSPISSGITVIDVDDTNTQKEIKKKKWKKLRKALAEPVRIFRTLFFISGGIALAGLITFVIGFLSLANTGNEDSIIVVYIGYLALAIFSSIAFIMGLLWLIFYLVDNA